MATSILLCGTCLFLCSTLTGLWPPCPSLRFHRSPLVRCGTKEKRMSTDPQNAQVDGKKPTSPLTEAIAAVTKQAARALRSKAQPQEWKLISLRECPSPETLPICDTPDRARDYWQQHISTHPFF